MNLGKLANPKTQLVEDESESRFRDYRAPSKHGEALIDPRLDEADTMVKANRELLDQYGDFFTSLRSRARSQMLEDSLRYTSAYRDVTWARERLANSDAAEISIIMAGHQPALFHPGVWFKNFALDHIGRQLNQVDQGQHAIPVNLVIDNDVAPGSSIRVPVDGGRSRVTVPYDTAGGGVPYEQTVIRDRQVFDHFDDAVISAMGQTSAEFGEPCVRQLWRHALEAIGRCGVAGCALAQARHGLEGEIGLQTLELPLSVLCRGAAFAEFALAILTQLPKFHDDYNQCTDAYRRAHGIRSSAHPVPNLSREGDWWEAPMWIFGNDDPQRKAAWVKMEGETLVLSDTIEPDDRARVIRIDTRMRKLAAEQLANLVNPDFKIRPRALVTTMYARLVLSDLFMHGIGGGKYDQLGDQIIERFFEVKPPQFMVISATVNLPGAHRGNAVERIEKLTRQLRDAVYQPERFADQVDMDSGLIGRKQALISQLSDTRPSKAWHDEVASINAALSKSLQNLTSQWRELLVEAKQEAAGDLVQSSREHPFCVFPLQYLLETYRKLL
ncbi:hypothetical protein Pla22_23760 [Rubripirellula amarantea]|uniref:Uncharacterized protein n=1 Tax=Rubripirellula amarantea TaxID=2527999 RepID=A0A5C5WUT5_9BACT|nr:hypothetical protein [Rubripirellula amarantea]TWT54724.1 hypothetical protein Pla22_23760 [Rubripirellula amarantea]